MLSCSEPHGGEQGAVPDHRVFALVRALVHHPLPQQEGLARREDHDLTPRRLLPRIRRYLSHSSYSPL